MRECKKCIRSQNSLHFHTKQMRALSLDQTLGLRVRAQNLYSLLDLMLPEAQPGVWAMGIHRQKHKSAHKTTDVM